MVSTGLSRSRGRSRGGSGGGVILEPPSTNLFVNYRTDVPGAIQIVGSGVDKFISSIGPTPSEDLRQLTDSLRPIVIPNFLTGGVGPLDGIRGDGVDDYLRTLAGHATLSQPNTIAMIVGLEAISAGNATAFDSSSGASSRQVIDYVTGGTRYDMFAGTNLIEPGATVDLDPHYYVCRFNGGSSEFRVDGALVATGNAGTQSNLGTSLFIKFDNTQPANLTIVQVLKYNGDVAGQDLIDLEAYLSQRSGI